MPLIFQLQISSMSTLHLHDLFCPFANIRTTASIIHTSALGSHVVVLNRFEDAEVDPANIIS